MDCKMLVYDLQDVAFRRAQLVSRFLLTVAPSTLLLQLKSLNCYYCNSYQYLCDVCTLKLT